MKTASVRSDLVADAGAKRVGPVGDPAGLLDPEERGRLLLEPLRLVQEEEAARGEHALEGRGQLGNEGAYLP